MAHRKLSLKWRRAAGIRVAWRLALVLAAVAFMIAPSLVPPPAEASISIRGKLTHEKQAMPGETYESGIYITNTGDEAEQVKVYQTDYLFSYTGEYFYNQLGSNPRSNGGWIEYGPTRLAVPAHGNAVVSYKVRVPDDPSLVGTYWSILMVEVIGKGSPEEAAESDGQVKMAVNQVFRYGVQIVTHIDDTGERKIRFIDSRLLKDGDARILRVDLENIGQRWLRPSLWAEIYDTSGAFVGKFDAGALRVYPGTSVRFKVDLTSLATGTYKAVVIADCGEDDVFGATYSLSVGNESSTPDN
jgi:hypothetical protein